MTEPRFPRRGDVWVANLEPRRGTEPGKVRPVAVVQTDLLNPHHTSTLVCPITTKDVGRESLLRVRLGAGEGGIDRESEVMVDQVRAIDNTRLHKLAGRIAPERLRELREKLISIFDLD